jgi:Lipoprotein LpqB beta-propeller domain
MKRQRLFVPLAVVAALGAALAATSCGVPGRTDVVVDGERRNGPVQDSYGGEEVLPPGPAVPSNNVDEFVKRFLEAPAGDWAGAGARVKQFLMPQAEQSWQAPEKITVVRLIGGKPEIKQGPTSEVTLKVQQIGTLDNHGRLEASQTSEPATYKFTVGATTAPRGGLAVLNPPQDMLLTDTGLKNWYERRTIYFWDSKRNLVPDLRYLPRAVEDAARPNLLIDWLLDDPAEWLKRSVLELPEGTKRLGNAYQDDDGRLIVNLSNAATGQNQSIDQLLAQLCWSLRADFTGDIVLQIEFQKRGEGSTSDYVGRNPAYRLSEQGEELFAVADGVVRRVQTDDAQVKPDVPPVDSAVNKNVRYAAISSEYAALVRTDGDQLRLWFGPNQQGGVVAKSLRARAMSRPVLSNDQGAGYVAADGKLYQFSVDTAKVNEVSVSGLPGGVTSVALAPDGRRLAVVAGGRPYLVALSGDGGGSTGAARAVTSPLTNLIGISWVNETSLAMVGSDRTTPTLVNVSLDGGVLTAQQELSVSPVTELVSYPENPLTEGGGQTMIEADNRAYYVYSSSVLDLAPDKLTGTPPPAKGAVPTAPFFME